MAKYRAHLPQLDGGLFLTDGGLETTLYFRDGIEIPCFAAFDLLKDEAGTQRLRDYFGLYAGIARSNGVGFVLETVTWRANADWGRKIGYSSDALVAANHDAVALLTDIRDVYETEQSPMPISGCIGPRGDGYTPGEMMSEAEAEDYHRTQIQILGDTEADFVSALTLSNTREAIGIARAAQGVGIPAVISFTVETDGRLPTGQSLKDAIAEVDAATNEGPAYYMINCAHPIHYEPALAAGEDWIKRLRGLRSNASKLSHAELDEAEVLDEGDPVDLGQRHAALKRRFGHINVLGGCCGTDHRHVEQICGACCATA